jgi:hypothetical protein
MDIASGHFSRIEYASNGSLPGSLISEFTHIAREYVNAVSLGKLQPIGPDRPPSSKSSSSGNQNQLPASDAEAEMDRQMLNPNILPTQQPQQLGPSLMDPMDAQQAKISPSQQTLESSELPPSSGVDNALMDTLCFPLTGTPLVDGDSGLPMGIDVMDLFNAFIPGTDPLFFNQWNDGDTGTYYPSGT